MNKIFRGLVLSFSFLGVSSILLFSASSAQADKIQDLQRQLTSKKVMHAVLQKKATDLNSEVKTLKKDLVDVSKDLRIRERTISKTDQRLKNLRLQKARYFKSLYQDQTSMGGLISAARRYSQTPTTSMLLQTTPKNAAQAQTLMKSLIPTLQHQSEDLKSRLVKLSSIESKIKKQLNIQTKENKKLNREKTILTSLLNKRKELYKNTEYQRTAQKNEVLKLTKESKNLEELLKKLKVKEEKKAQIKTTRFELPLNTPLPVHGTIHIGFNDLDDIGAKSKGVTFKTRRKATVIIPLDGTVKFAGPFQHYKQILIVEHNGGYHSLIAGLGEIDTVVGASLAAGEPVGSADDTDAPHIYYELRKDGKPINPRKLIVAQKVQKKS